MNFLLLEDILRSTSFFLEVSLKQLRGKISKHISPLRLPLLVIWNGQGPYQKWKNLSLRDNGVF